MASLVEAMSPEALTVEIAAGAALAGPVEIVHVAIGDGACSLYSWTEIALGAGARATRRRDLPRRRRRRSAARRDEVRLAEGAKLKHVAAVGDDAGAASRKPARRARGRRPS